MPRRRSKGPSEAQLTPGQRKGLQHLRAAEQSGETIKAYAERQGLSVHGLYQAGKSLRRLGVLESRKPQPHDRAASRFVRVEPAAVRPPTAPIWRIRFPSGGAFESSTPLAHYDLVSVLTALNRLR